MYDVLQNNFFFKNPRPEELGSIKKFNNYGKKKMCLFLF